MILLSNSFFSSSLSDVVSTEEQCRLRESKWCLPLPGGGANSVLPVAPGESTLSGWTTASSCPAPIEAATNRGKDPSSHMWLDLIHYVTNRYPSWYNGGSWIFTIYFPFKSVQRSCWHTRPRGGTLRRTWRLLRSRWGPGSPSPPACRPSPSQTTCRTSGARRSRPSQLESSELLKEWLLHISVSSFQWLLSPKLLNCVVTFLTSFSQCICFPLQNFPLRLLPRVSDCAGQEIHIRGRLGAEEIR